jgi:hypothetical protein
MQCARFVTNRSDRNGAWVLYCYIEHANDDRHHGNTGRNGRSRKLGRADSPDICRSLVYGGAIDVKRRKLRKLGYGSLGSIPIMSPPVPHM